MEGTLQGSSSRVSAEYDAFGQVIISEAGGKYSLRSRSSAGSRSRPGLTVEDARSVHSSVHSSDPAGHVNGLSPSAAIKDRIPTPTSVHSTDSPRYRRRSNTTESEPAATTGSALGGGGGTASSTSSSLLRRIFHRRGRDDDSDSETTSHYSENQQQQSTRGRGRRRKNRRMKKHKGRSIDKHSDLSADDRRLSTSDIFDVGGPDNEFWRGLMAEQRRRSSQDTAVLRRRRGSASASRRRGGGGGSNRTRLSTRPSRSNGGASTPEQTVSTGSAARIIVDDGDGRRSRRQRYSSSSMVDRDDDGRCAVVLSAVMFIAVGCLLIVAGVVRVLISFWHEFGGGIWTGALVSELLYTLRYLYSCNPCAVYMCRSIAYIRSLDSKQAGLGFGSHHCAVEYRSPRYSGSTHTCDAITKHWF